MPTLQKCATASDGDRQMSYFVRREHLLRSLCRCPAALRRFVSVKPWPPRCTIVTTDPSTVPAMSRVCLHRHGCSNHPPPSALASTALSSTSVPVGSRVDGAPSTVFLPRFVRNHTLMVPGTPACRQTPTNARMLHGIAASYCTPLPRDASRLWVQQLSHVNGARSPD